MQNSELFRRAIVVPLDNAAAKALTQGEVDSKTRVHVVSFASDEEFEKVLETGIFDTINEIADSLIGDYEEDAIDPSMLPEVARAVELQLQRKNPTRTQRRLLFEFLEATHRAQRANQPMFFIF